MHCFTAIPWAPKLLLGLWHCAPFDCSFICVVSTLAGLRQFPGSSMKEWSQWSCWGGSSSLRSWQCRNHPGKCRWANLLGVSEITGEGWDNRACDIGICLGHNSASHPSVAAPAREGSCSLPELSLTAPISFQWDHCSSQGSTERKESCCPITLVKSPHQQRSSSKVSEVERSPGANHIPQILTRSSARLDSHPSAPQQRWMLF